MDQNREPPLELPSINSPIAVQEMKKLLFVAVGVPLPQMIASFAGQISE